MAYLNKKKGLAIALVVFLICLALYSYPKLTTYHSVAKTVDNYINTISTGDSKAKQYLIGSAWYNFKPGNKKINVEIEHKNIASIGGFGIGKHAVIDTRIIYDNEDIQEYRFHLYRPDEQWKIYKIERLDLVVKGTGINQRRIQQAEKTVSEYIKTTADGDKTKIEKYLCGQALAAAKLPFGSLPEFNVQNIITKTVGRKGEMCIVEAAYTVSADFYNQPKEVKTLFTLHKVGDKWKIAAVDALS